MSERDNIISFPCGLEKKGKQEPDAELVGAIEAMLEDARKGEIQGLIAVTTHANNSVSRWDFGEHKSYPVAGALQKSAMVVLDSAEERRF
nr:hypothetical protein [uncultured Cohaesibacter sp.]